jgi:serine/threonine-protein kinase HipA
VDLELAKLHTVALAMVGHTSISGMQRKISAGLSADRATLRTEIEGGLYILKPQTEKFPALPELELTTMRIAEAAGVEIPPCGLVTLRDGSIAYVIRRFDRADDGKKFHMEDFCQLSGQPAKDKYHGSAELCMRLVRRYASEPLVESAKLFRQLLVSWWLGNGDLHLKNLALLVGGDGLVRLSPAYDLLSTKLLIPDDQLALSMGGKRDGLTRRHWLELADYAGLPRRAAEGVMARVASAARPAAELIAASPLTPDTQAAFTELSRALA